MKETKFGQMSLEDKIVTFVIYAFLTLVTLVILYPIVYVVAASFSSPQAVISGQVKLFPVDFTLRGYEAVLKNGKLINGFLNSIFYVAVSLVLNLTMTMLCAYPLSRKEFTA